MDDLLQQGITAFRAGKREEARKIFATVVKQSPDNDRAWGWMYDVSNNDKERIYCLKQMLRINPKNDKANQLLNQLLAPPITSNTSLDIAPQKIGNNTWIISLVAISFIIICAVILGGGYAIYGLNRQIPNAEINIDSEIVIQTAIAQTQAVLVTPTLVVTPTLAAIPTTENQGYLIKEIPIFNSFSETYLEFAKEDMRLLSNNPDLFLDQTWRNQVNGTLEKLLSLANEMESIEPVPQEYIIFDGYHDQIAVELREMVFYYQLWLNGDNSASDKGLENIHKIGILLELLNNEEKRLANP